MTPAEWFPRRALPAVLLYHRVAETDDRADPLCVTPAQFEAQMRCLVDHGYATPGPSSAGRVRKPVVITFDDGYLDTYSTALPILQRHGLTATVFIVSGSIGATSGEWGPRAPVPLLSWRQVEEMVRLGITFQSHGRAHLDLTRCSDAVALSDLVSSRAEIEDRIGAAVDALAYPFGKFDARVMALVEQARYRSAWAAGLATRSPWSGERFQICARDTLPSFLLKASGWGGWLRRTREAARACAAGRASAQPSPLESKTC